MKTFKQLQDEACKKEPLNTYGKLNDFAAKEYVKQWIDYALENGFVAGPSHSIIRLKKLIDEQ